MKTMAASTPAKPFSRVALVAQALWPCAFYFACSFAMNMLTKTIITTYEWRSIYTLGTVQNVFTMAAIGSYQLVLALHSAWQERNHCSSVGKLEAKTTRVAAAASLEPLPSTSLLRVILPLVTLHIGNMVLGFAAMRMVNMPMYLVLRRLTTIKVLLIEWLVLHKELSLGIKLALLVSTTGSIIAGSTDATFESWGYMLVILQNICSACSLTFAKESKLPSSHIVLVNSIAGSVVCAVLAFFLESEAVASFQYDAAFVAVVAFMCCVCVLYQFAIMICTMRNSALATSVTGNVKDLASTTCGFVFFNDVQVRAANVLGVALSLVGAYTFSYLKFVALTQTVDVMNTHRDKKTR